MSIKQTGCSKRTYLKEQPVFYKSINFLLYIYAFILQNLLCKECCRKIAVAGIRKKSNNCLSLVFRTCSKNFCSLECSTRRYSYKNSFRTCKYFSFCKCIFIFYRNYLILNLCIQCIRNKSRSDSLNFMRTGNSL